MILCLVSTTMKYCTWICVNWKFVSYTGTRLKGVCSYFPLSLRCNILSGAKYTKKKSSKNSHILAYDNLGLFVEPKKILSTFQLHSNICISYFAKNTLCLFKCKVLNKILRLVWLVNIVNPSPYTQFSPNN